MGGRYNNWGISRGILCSVKNVTSTKKHDGLKGKNCGRTKAAK
jgi:hypothetical protein